MASARQQHGVGVSGSGCALPCTPLLAFTTHQMVARLAICVRWLMLITLMALLGGGEARRLSNNPRGAFITPRSRTLGSVGGARSGGRCERRLAGDRRRSQQPLEASATQPDDVRTDDCALDANAGLAFAAGACVCM